MTTQYVCSLFSGSDSDVLWSYLHRLAYSSGREKKKDVIKTRFVSLFSHLSVCTHNDVCQWLILRFSFTTTSEPCVVTTKHIRMCKYKAKIDWTTVYKTLEDPVASLTDWRQRWTLTHSEADKLALWTQYVGLCVVAQCFMSKDDV